MMKQPVRIVAQQQYPRCRLRRFLARSLDIDVVAEGVETAEKLEWLLDHGCVLFQGNLFSPPVHKDQASKMLMQLSS